jgi:hypothetical protein
MGIDYRETVVNGNDVQLWGQSQRSDSATRRVAAALPRNADIRRVEAETHEGRACIWYDPCSGPNDPDRHGVPDGWTATQFDLFENGALAVTVEPATEGDA